MYIRISYIVLYVYMDVCVSSRVRLSLSRAGRPVNVDSRSRAQRDDKQMTSVHICRHQRRKLADVAVCYLPVMCCSHPELRHVWNSCGTFLLCRFRYNVDDSICKMRCAPEIVMSLPCLPVLCSLTRKFGLRLIFSKEQILKIRPLQGNTFAHIFMGMFLTIFQIRLTLCTVRVHKRLRGGILL
jgi:hypothetical protein